MFEEYDGAWAELCVRTYMAAVNARAAERPMNWFWIDGHDVACHARMAGDHAAYTTERYNGR